MDRKWFASGVIIIALTPIAYWGVSIWEKWYCETFSGPCLTTASFGAVLLFSLLGAIFIIGALKGGKI